jgi:hypothetical protein
MRNGNQCKRFHFGGVRESQYRTVFQQPVELMLRQKISASTNQKYRQDVDFGPLYALFK